MRFTYSSAVLFMAAFLFTFFTSCEEDDVTITTGEGRFTLEITDAPVDDPDVQAVFITIADLRVGGASVSGFSRTTLEISALRNGVTQLLADLNLEARAYSSVELVLDAANDANNTGGPGCYVRNAANQKLALDLAGNSSLRIPASDFELAQGGSYRAVADFDLRKALVRTGDAARPYAFAPAARLSSSLRLVNRAETGTLTGNIRNDSGESGRLVVFAYRSGTFTEAETRGEEDALFLNAVTSTTADAAGDFQLSFLESGAYELVVANFADTDNDGAVEFKGRFRLEALLNLNLSSVNVAANATTTANFSLRSFFP